jgi:hypothetical protein
MKYRIKIYTYKNGRKEFEAQVKKRFTWLTINVDGDATIMQGVYVCDSRYSALKRIDKHYAGNTKLQTIEFEYINK